MLSLVGTPRSTARQFVALTGVLGRELRWVAPNVAKEIRAWRKRAEAIPDSGLRRDALDTLRTERLNPEGAALFTALPRRRDLGLLRVLVAFQVALDYLDTVSEQPANDSLAHGMQMHRALTEALDPSGGVLTDYYALRPWQNDGGYLGSLVETCRAGCAALPGFELVQPQAMRAARRLSVQVLNHQPERIRRTLLTRYASEELDDMADTTWFERTAAASSTLGLYALLALAVEDRVDPLCADEIDLAYHPWINLACTLMDCFVDQFEDAAARSHNYLSRYPDSMSATDRLATIVTRSMSDATKLHRGARHAVIVSAMVAMYLSKESADTAELRPAARRIASSGGILVRCQLPILRGIRRSHDLSRA